MSQKFSVSFLRECSLFHVTGLKSRLKEFRMFLKSNLVLFGHILVATFEALTPLLELTPDGVLVFATRS